MRRNTALSLVTPSPRRRNGVTLIYVIIFFAVLCGLGSLAIDMGHAQTVKMQLRRVADATAHDYIQLYNMGGTSYANTNGPATYSSGENPVDCPGGNPTVTVTWGFWNNGSFSTSGAGSTAVKVVASCTAANNNATRMYFASLIGQRTIDISATSIAAVSTNPSVTMNVPSTSNLYLAGMPNGTTSAYGDTVAANGATSVTGIPVKPGTYISFNTFTGTTSVLPGYMPYYGPGGCSGYYTGTAIHHGENWDGGLSASGYSENGIADAVMPESALCGLFLTDTQPDQNTAPASIDWTNSSNSNNAVYNNLLNQQPFLIGTGQTTGGTVKKFLVPPGATRLFISVWDGVANNNNGGSFNGTITQYSTVQLVQ